MIQTYSILIADDDDAWRSTLQSIFEPSGYQTLLAANGEEALALLDRTIHCVLLDMHLPDCTGLDLLRQVRQRRQSLPCIMITGDSSQQVVHCALSLHAYTVLTKPVSRELVTVTVRRALDSAFPAIG